MHRRCPAGRFAAGPGGDLGAPPAGSGAPADAPGGVGLPGTQGPVAGAPPDGTDGAPAAGDGSGARAPDGGAAAAAAASPRAGAAGPGPAARRP